MKAGAAVRLGVWLALLAWFVVAPAWSAQTLRIDTGDFILAPAAQPPGQEAAWRPQTLPDPWRIERPGADGVGWYRFRFHSDALEISDPLQAVYLPKLIMNAAVWVNGVPIGDGGRMDGEAVARNWNRPLLFLVHPGLLRRGDNEIHVRLRAHAYTQATLEPFWIGPERILRPPYERALFLNVTINQTASLLIGAIGLLTLTLWWRRRRDTAYGYFGLSALVWAIQSTNLYVRDTPFATAQWEIFANAGFQVFAGLLLISLLRFIGIDRRGLNAAVGASVIIAPITLLLTPAPHFLTLTAIWHLYTLATTILTFCLLLRAAWFDSNRDARFLAAAMVVLVIFALHDWLIHSQHLWLGATPWPLQDVFLLHYGAPMLFLAVGLVMTGRYVQVLNEFESLNNELEARVAENHAQLQESYTRMRTLEMERAVTDERERIYRDLHDDVGAKLLSLVYRAGRPEDADLARSALSDLREVVSRTGADCFELDELVADWRSECERRLADAGITLHWRQSVPIQGATLGQPQALNLGRILREAVSNVIRHACAHQVWVTICCNEQMLHLEIRDDGIGSAASTSDQALPNMATTRRGRGVRNMEARAARLGGVLSRRNDDAGGHVVALRMPCLEMA